MSAAEKARTKPTGANHNLWQIAKLGDVDQLERALARGADVNACNNLGLTPLMMAAYHGQTDMVKALVEHGADVNAVDGLTAAILAKDSGRAEIQRTLVARGVKRSPAASQTEPSVVRFAKSESVDALDDHEEVSKAKVPKVRTLKEPPEIWDLVHEARPDFRPSSLFAEHLVRLHPLVLAGILVVIGCGVGFLFAALGTRTNTASVAPQTDHDAASFPLTSDRTNATSPLNPKSPLSGRTPSANQDLTKTPTPTNPVRDTLEALRKVDGGVGGESSAGQHVTKGDDEGNANHEGFESEASADGARLSSHRSSKRSVARSKNKAALVRQSEDENKATPTLSKQADEAPSPESISPAKPPPTPKPKVIPWP